MNATATLLATVIPSVVSHASAMLAHTVITDLTQAALVDTAWIKRLIVEACMQAFN